MTAASSTIAITGSTGLIGSKLVSHLREEGYRLRILVHRRPQTLPSVEVVQGDITNPASVNDLVRGCSVVIHLAGIAHVALTTKAQQDAAELVNVGGTRHVLAAARAAGLERVLLISSAHVYAGQQGTDLREDSPTAADSYYTRAKMLVEQAGLEYAAQPGPSITIIRPSLIYGPNAPHNLESLMRAVHRGYYFHIRGVRPLRSLLSTGTAAAGIAHLLRAGENGKIYNLTGREPISLVDFVNAIADRMDVSRPRTLPSAIVRMGAWAAAPFEHLGLRLPVNRDTLHKLTSSFTLNVDALAATGFHWPDDADTTRNAMVDAYLASQQ